MFICIKVIIGNFQPGFIFVFVKPVSVLIDPISATTTAILFKGILCFMPFALLIDNTETLKPPGGKKPYIRLCLQCLVNRTSSAKLWVYPRIPIYSQGMKIAGMRLATLISFTPRKLYPMAATRRLPTADISRIMSGLR